jgi:hypothetical protein
MSVKKSFVEDLFNNLNDGEILGFWRSAPISYLIIPIEKTPEMNIVPTEITQENILIENEGIANA